MNGIALGLAIVGVIVAAIGLATWRTAGRGLVLSGAIFVAFAASLLLADSSAALRYASKALLVLLIVASFITVDRGVRRQMRLELGLAVAAALTVLASYFLTNISPTLDAALLVLLVILVISFFAVTIFRMVRLHRAATAK